MTQPIWAILAISCVIAGSAPPVSAQPVDEAPTAPEAAASVAAMTGQRLIELVTRIDPELEAAGSGARFKIQEHELMLVFDEAANRMRVMAPVANSAALEPEFLTRMLQANFDSALDARYAIASDIVWSVYIHPLAELTETQFASALAQVVTAAATYGGSFSSGALVYGGGDSAELNEKLLRELEKRLQTEA